jgi:hypothetical protein
MSTEPLLPAHLVVRRLWSFLHILPAEIYADVLAAGNFDFEEFPKKLLIEDYKSAVAEAANWLRETDKMQAVWRSRHTAASTVEEAT